MPMEVRAGGVGMQVAPVTTSSRPQGSSDPGAGASLGDPSRVLQILTAEHTSLTAMRSQGQSENVEPCVDVHRGPFGRTRRDRVHRPGDAFRTGIRGIRPDDSARRLFIGITTFVRTLDLNADDVRWTAAPNRVRRAYVDIEPSVDRYLTTGHRDDVPGVVATMSPGPIAAPNLWARCDARGDRRDRRYTGRRPRRRPGQGRRARYRGCTGRRPCDRGLWHRTSHSGHPRFAGLRASHPERDSRGCGD
jgi:hypothetical protein